MDKEQTAYFLTYEAASEFGALHCKGYPAWRVNYMPGGWFVEVSPNGDRLSTAGTPVDREER